jgi:hypothetical protein
MDANMVLSTIADVREDFLERKVLPWNFKILFRWASKHALNKGC